MKDDIDPQLRDQQAGFLKDSSCHVTYHLGAVAGVVLTTLWQLCRLRKSVRQRGLSDALIWKLLRHNGVPEKITNINRNSCQGTDL